MAEDTPGPPEIAGGESLLLPLGRGQLPQPHCSLAEGMEASGTPQEKGRMGFDTSINGQKERPPMGGTFFFFFLTNQQVFPKELSGILCLTLLLLI